MDLSGLSHDVVIALRLVNAVGMFAVAIGFVLLLRADDRLIRSRAQRKRYVALVMALSAFALDSAEQVWLNAPLGGRSFVTLIALVTATVALYATWREARRSTPVRDSQRRRAEPKC